MFTMLFFSCANIIVFLESVKNLINVFSILPSLDTIFDAPGVVVGVIPCPCLRVAYDGCRYVSYRMVVHLQPVGVVIPLTYRRNDARLSLWEHVDVVLLYKSLQRRGGDVVHKLQPRQIGVDWLCEKRQRIYRNHKIKSAESITVIGGAIIGRMYQHIHREILVMVDTIEGFCSNLGDVFGDELHVFGLVDALHDAPGMIDVYEKHIVEHPAQLQYRHIKAKTAAKHHARPAPEASPCAVADEFSGVVYVRRKILGGRDAVQQSGHN